MAQTRGPAPLVTLARAHVASMAGDAFLTVSLAGSLFFTVPSAAARGRVMLYLVLTMAPFAVVAPIVGPALDRLPTSRKIAMAATGLGRAVVVLLMARDLRQLSLYPEAFVALVLTKAYSVIKNAVVPTTVADSADLVDANARLARVALVGGALAGLVASAILKVFGGDWTLRVGAIVYLAAAVMAFKIQTLPERPQAEPRTAGGPTVYDGEAASGGPEAPTPPAGQPPVALPRAHRPMWWPAPLALPPSVTMSATAMGMLRAAVGFVTFLLAFALKGRGEPTWFFGVVLAASVASSFVGSVVAPIARRVASEEHILGGCLLGAAVVAAVAAWRHNRFTIVAIAVALGVAASAGRLAFDSLVQRDAPASARGRTFARLETRFQLTWAIGALIPTALRLRLASGLSTLAVGLALAGVSYLSTLRGHRAATRQLGTQGPYGT